MNSATELHTIGYKQKNQVRLESKLVPKIPSSESLLPPVMPALTSDNLCERDLNFPVLSSDGSTGMLLQVAPGGFIISKAIPRRCPRAPVNVLDKFMNRNLMLYISPLSIHAIVSWVHLKRKVCSIGRFDAHEIHCPVMSSICASPHR